MHRFTLRQLEYFVAVGETESIARAARTLRVTSPSISAAISQLEQAFGVQLFVRRHAQGLSLTPGGRRMMERARGVLGEAGALEDAASEIAGSARGPLAIGCLVTFAQLVLPAMRRTFEARHSEVRVTQHELDQAGIIDGLRRSRVDVALTYDLDVPTDLRFTGLALLRPLALMAPGHPLAGTGAVNVNALRAYPMVLLDLPLSASYFLGLFDDGPTPPIAERTRDMAVMRSMVANGFGFSIVNLRPPSDAAPDGLPVRCIPIDGPVRALRMGLLSTADAGRPNVVRAFAEHAADTVRSGALKAFGGEALL